MKKYPDFSLTNSIADEDLLLFWNSTTNANQVIKVKDLKTYFGSSSAEPPSSSEKILTYAFDGDANGVFYYLGTNEGKNAWSNPHIDGKVTITQSSAFSSQHSNPHLLVNRQVDELLATANIPNSSIVIDLLSHRLNPNTYSIRARNFSSANLRNWKFQVSENKVDWLDLDTQANRSLSQNQWFTNSLASSAKFFRYFKILQYDVNTSNDHILCVGELEIYGKLI